MGKHTTTQIIFAPRGDFASDAIKPKNIHLAISLDDTPDSYFYGYGIDHSVRQSRLEAIMIKHHGEEILNTHNAWQITVSHDTWNNGNPHSQAAWHACCINNPSYRKSNLSVRFLRIDNDDDWKSEQSMMNGMAFGTQGYNDTMGW